jgi:hypothetical protein
VERSVAGEAPFRAVVADSFYGEAEDLKGDLERGGVRYVMALKESHCWWHLEGTIGALWEAAECAGWKSAGDPGRWEKVIRTFRDGHQEAWWTLEVEVEPYGPQRARRALVVTTDPERLPRLGTWYLNTNLPAPDSERARDADALAPTSVAEVVRLYGLRMWVEQSYKQVKHALGWSDYQVRSDTAIRRHWRLVFCAFPFCWWACGEELDLGAPPGVVLEADGEQEDPVASEVEEARGKKERASSSSADVSASAQAGEGVAGTIRNAHEILEIVHRQGSARRVESVA